MKNTIIKTSLFAITLFSTSHMMSQTIDAKSKTLLDAVTQQYKNKSNNYFKFSYGNKNGGTNKLQPGIFYSAGDKYKLKIMETEQIFDGKKVYNIDTNMKEVTVASPNENSAMLSPLSYLESYKKDYNVSFVGNKTVNGVNTNNIKLTPINGKGIKYVNLFINPKNKQLTEIEQVGTDGSISSIKIQKYVANQNLDKNFFSYDKNKYANYLVTEL